MDDMSNAKEMVDDYMERNQEDFDEFSTPDDVYEEILQDLDSLEVSEPCLLQKSLCACIVSLRSSVMSCQRSAFSVMMLARAHASDISAEEADAAVLLRPSLGHGRCSGASAVKDESIEPGLAHSEDDRDIPVDFAPACCLQAQLWDLPVV